MASPFLCEGICLPLLGDGGTSYDRTKALHSLHREGRVLTFFSSRRNWDSPNPSPACECAPPPPVLGEGHTLKIYLLCDSPHLVVFHVVKSPALSSIYRRICIYLNMVKFIYLCAYVSKAQEKYDLDVFKCCQHVLILYRAFWQHCERMFAIFSPLRSKYVIKQRRYYTFLHDGWWVDWGGILVL